MPNCPKCNKPNSFLSILYPSQFKAERKVSMGKDWHASCLRCFNEPCGKVLTPGGHSEVVDSFFNHNGLPYCNLCYRALFGPKACFSCVSGYGHGGTESHTFHGGKTG
ncbi:cysteine-rich protein 2 [Trichinella spiralis]|uniref:cysteine-rich protein 2 n=1 Tax=Trichinella spiralis TaxID=6334 RepID=UPI0001EFB7D5|nr:cysteine-rich protein 2 [Trichinella spiralis]